MAEMVLTPSQSEGKEANFIQKFGRAFIHGDVFTKLSLVVWGFGYIGHGQLIKALLVTLVQGPGLYFLGTSGIPALKKFGTLGTVQMEMQFNPITLKNEVNNYDNSFAILLLSVIALVVIASLVSDALRQRERFLCFGARLQAFYCREVQELGYGRCAAKINFSPLISCTGYSTTM